MVTHAAVEQYKTIQTYTEYNNTQLYDLVSAYKTSFSEFEKLIHDYSTQASKYAASAVQYIDYFFQTIIETIMRFLQQIIARSKTVFSDQVSVVFKNKTVEMFGHKFDNFPAPQHSERQTGIPVRSKDTTIF